MKGAFKNESEATAMRPTEVRAANRRVVLAELRRAGAGTRAELAVRTSLSAQALGPILAELVSAGVVTEEATAVRSPGRPPSRFTADPACDLTLALTVGRHQVTAAIVDASGNAGERRSRIVAGDAGADATVDDLARWVRDELLDTGVKARIRRIGVAVEGSVEPGTTIVRGATGWRDAEADVAELVARHAALPVAVCALDRAAMTGALIRVQPAADELVAVLDFSNLMTLGLAVGATLVTNRDGLLGSLAHVEVAGNSRRCDCGRVGCLITVGGGRAFERRYRELSGHDGVTAVELIGRVRAGDPHAIEASAEVGAWVARGVLPLLQALRPDRVVLTGAVGRPLGSGVRAIADRIRDGLGAPDLPVDAASSQWHLAALRGIWSIAFDRIDAADLVDAGAG